MNVRVKTLNRIRGNIYTLGLKSITGDGQEIITGVRTTKGVVGYDLTRLIVGSEGTLAIITEATLRLTRAAGGLI